VVVSAVGYLNNPRFPDWPHLSDFTAVAFHSARWEPVDLAGKRVAVVGTGSGAAQIVGAIAAEVGELLVFQRDIVGNLPIRNFTYGILLRLLGRPSTTTK
jgi:cation diffusion facilitator CzcD-associated flavoprotein CzcO